MHARRSGNPPCRLCNVISPHWCAQAGLQLSIKQIVVLVTWEIVEGIDLPWAQGINQQGQGLHAHILELLHVCSHMPYLKKKWCVVSVGGCQTKLQQMHWGKHTVVLLRWLQGLLPGEAATAVTIAIHAVGFALAAGGSAADTLPDIGAALDQNTTVTDTGAATAPAAAAAADQASPYIRFWCCYGWRQVHALIAWWVHLIFLASHTLSALLVWAFLLGMFANCWNGLSCWGCLQTVGINHALIIYSYPAMDFCSAYWYQV
jgi:hypothetical protein